MHADDTVAALSTPPGRSAVAVVRMSGPASREIAQRVLQAPPDVSRTVRLTALLDPRDGSLIDRVVATFFTAPHSYTGEDVLELTTHGGLAAPTAALEALLACGARLALPGEFTRRAVLNGKLDLIQAEATGDLIDATSSAMRRAAVSQLDGGLSRRIASLRNEVLELEALIAYDIDFPEEDDGPVPRGRVESSGRALIASIEALLATAPTGQALREGAVVVIAGAPNVGKSSLFNALLGEARAIVTNIPGTTRDALEAVIDTRPLPLRLIDTAGLRDTTELVERLGIEVSERWLARAHVVLACGDSAEAVHAARERIQQLCAAPVLEVFTKRDLQAAQHATGLHVSSETGDGLRDLLTAVLDTVGAALSASMDSPVLVHARHQHALSRACDELNLFVTAWQCGHLPAPVAAVHVRAAVHALDELIGAVSTDDVLGRVFERFCVGK